MGYIRHEALIVTISERYIGKLEELALSIFPSCEVGSVSSRINGYKTVFIGPDGSKEGWEDSDDGDEQRESFLRRLSGSFYEEFGYPAIVRVKYGLDDGCATVRFIDAFGDEF